MASFLSANIRSVVYADDILIISENQHELETFILYLEKKCDTLKLSINKNKTKIMIVD